MEKKLKILALQNIRDISQKLDSDVTTLAQKKLCGKEDINVQKDLYPLGSKAREISKWIDALLEID